MRFLSDSNVKQPRAIGPVIEGAGAPEIFCFLRPKVRARGTPDAKRIRSLACKSEKAHER